MAKLDILCYPDPKLHTVAKPVSTVDRRVQTLIADMLETMYEAEGIGLAATQVDVHERLIVIDVSDGATRPGADQPATALEQPGDASQRRGLSVGARHLRRRGAL